jgi:hypothetical protein
MIFHPSTPDLQKTEAGPTTIHGSHTPETTLREPDWPTMCPRLLAGETPDLLPRKAKDAATKHN